MKTNSFELQTTTPISYSDLAAMFERAYFDGQERSSSVRTVYNKANASVTFRIPTTSLYERPVTFAAIEVTGLVQPEPDNNKYTSFSVTNISADPKLFEKAVEEVKAALSGNQ